MKSSFVRCVFVLASCLASLAAQAQWLPTTATSTDPIRHDGRVAVGTASTTPDPNFGLDVAGYTQGINVDATCCMFMEFRKSGDPLGYLSHAGTGSRFVLSSWTGKALSLGAAGEQFTILPSGFIGMNTLTPANRLHIYDGRAAVSQPTITLEGFPGGWGTGIEFSAALTGGGLTQMAKIVADGESAWNTTASYQDAGLRFFTTSDGVPWERMRLNNLGNLGLIAPGLAWDNPGPLAPLQILASGTQHLPNPADDQLIFVQRSATSTTTARLAIISGATATASIDFGNPNTNADGRVQYDNGSKVMGFQTNGVNVNRMTLDGSGSLVVTGNITASGWIRGATVIGAVYQDVAEWVPATMKMTAGTVVILNPAANNEVMPSATAYDTTVAGVVSAQPGVILGVAGDSKAQIATTGRVRVWVDASANGIAIGDLLVTSDKTGMAMKSQPIEVGGFKIHRPGTLIGKALEPLPTGQGEILVLLSLQ